MKRIEAVSTRYTGPVDNWRAFIMSETLYSCTCLVFKKVLVLENVCQILEFFLLNPFAEIILEVSWRKYNGFFLLQDEDENKTCSYVLSFTEKILFLKNKQALYTLRWRDKVYLDKGSERGSCMVLTKRQSYFRMQRFVKHKFVCYNAFG